MERKTELQLSQWGNSLAVRLPKSLLKELQLKADDRLSCRLENRHIILEPISPRQPSLDDLLSQVIETDEEVDWGQAQGREEW